MTPLTVMLLLASRRALPVTVRLEPIVLAPFETLRVEPSFRRYFQPVGTMGAP